MSIITKENQRLYLPSWGYNAALIMSKLAEIVKDNGGKVKPLKTALISNRTLTRGLREDVERLAHYEKIIEEGHGNEITLKAAGELRDKIARYRSINNQPVMVTHTTYITFILDGYIYYYQLDENPFFDFIFTKTAINNNHYSRDAVSELASKDWLYDCFFEPGCSPDDITEAAYLIFNQLVNAPESQIVRERTRKRGQNISNAGWHYEYVNKPGRYEAVDW